MTNKIEVASKMISEAKEIMGKISRKDIAEYMGHFLAQTPEGCTGVFGIFSKDDDSYSIFEMIFFVFDAKDPDADRDDFLLGEYDGVPPIPGMRKTERDCPWYPLTAFSDVLGQHNTDEEYIDAVASDVEKMYLKQGSAKESAKIAADDHRNDARSYLAMYKTYGISIEEACLVGKMATEIEQNLSTILHMKDALDLKIKADKPVGIAVWKDERGVMEIVLDHPKYDPSWE